MTSTLSGTSFFLITFCFALDIAVLLTPLLQLLYLVNISLKKLSGYFLSLGHKALRLFSISSTSKHCSSLFSLNLCLVTSSMSEESAIKRDDGLLCNRSIKPFSILDKSFKDI